MAIVNDLQRGWFPGSAPNGFPGCQTAVPHGQRLAGQRCCELVGSLTLECFRLPNMDDLGKQRYASEDIDDSAICWWYARSPLVFAKQLSCCPRTAMSPLLSGIGWCGISSCQRPMSLTSRKRNHVDIGWHTVGQCLNWMAWLSIANDQETRHELASRWVTMFCISSSAAIEQVLIAKAFRLVRRQRIALGLLVFEWQAQRPGPSHRGMDKRRPMWCAVFSLKGMNLVLQMLHFPRSKRHFLAHGLHLGVPTMDRDQPARQGCEALGAGANKLQICTWNKVPFDRSLVWLKIS